MSKNIINTANVPYEIMLKVKSEKLMDISIKGFEEKRPRTVYFNREYGNIKNGKPFYGTKVFRIPLPILPDNLKIVVTDNKTKKSLGLEIVDISIKKLNTRKKPLEKDIADYVDFIKEFTKNAHYLENGLYTSKNEKWKISITDQPYNFYLNSPIVGATAVTDHHSGIIQVERREFLKLTVSGMMITLLHEFIHYFLDTKDEQLCDIKGLEIYLNEGFSQIEAITGLESIFQSHLANHNTSPEHLKQMEDRIENIYKTITNINSNG